MSIVDISEIIFLAVVVGVGVVGFIKAAKS